MSVNQRLAGMMDPKHALRQQTVTHQETVAFAGGGAAFIDGPDDQALAAAHVASGKDAFDIGGKGTMLSFGIGAGVARDTELGQHGVFRTEESHGEKDQLSRPDFFGARHLDRNHPALGILLPVDLDGVDFLQLAILIADELFSGGEVGARIVAIECDGFFLAIIGFQDEGPLRPGIVRRARIPRPGRISIWLTVRQP